jgi:hypothetical protein
MCFPEEEIERFWTIDNNAAAYKPHLQDRAIAYKMAPGVGVHIPVNCPHWLQNDDNVSVSLSVNFQFKDPLRANPYRANFLLRKLGLKPTSPGISPALDSIKSQAVSRSSGRRIRTSASAKFPWLWPLIVACLPAFRR